MRATGLAVESGGRRHHPAEVGDDDPATLAPVDVVMFCVKLWDVEQARRRSRRSSRAAAS
jgi:2-dehydropantoate 2-reductase